MGLTEKRSKASASLLILFLPFSLLTAWLYPTVSYWRQLRQFDSAISLTKYANHTAVNNHRCVVHYEANACEDVKIHFESSTAFIACGEPAQRAFWYPPSCARDAAGRREDSFREDIFTYDIKTNRTTKLRIDGLEGDFITHGIEIYNLPDDPAKVHIFAVNHGRDGDSIVIFSHALGSDSVQTLKSVRHRGIKTANGVAASGPYNFFVTNDHYFPSGVLRDIEDKYGPWPGATNVQYCDASGEAVQCRQVSDSQPGYNGIALSIDKKTLFVGDSRIGVASVFNVSLNKTLQREKTIDLGAAADNIRILPTAGDPIVAVFATQENLPEYLSNIRALGRTLLVPSAAVRLVRERNYEPEVVFWDDGSVLSYMTVATIDPYNEVLIGGGVLQYGGFAVCDISL